MAHRAEPAGDMRHIAGKVAARYDSGVEAQILGWIEYLTGEKLRPGMREVEKQLRDGLILIRMAEKIREKTVNVPEAARKLKFRPSKDKLAFKQMENIEQFTKFCEKFGMGKNSRFETNDLYEGRNMAQVLSCIQLLGTECQRHGFNGEVIGPKPTEKHVVEFTEEQKRAGQSIIGLQAGTNKFASQSGMAMGTQRHIGDIDAGEISQDGKGVIGGQSGYAKGASQSGMSIGGRRVAADMKMEDMDREGQSIINLQAGSNQGASQAGMSFGGQRIAGDTASKIEEMDREGQTIVGLQAGSNKGATQSGMSFGRGRIAADMKDSVGEMDQMSHGVAGLQMGSNQGASQAGMRSGPRIAADMKVDDMDRSSQAVTGLQSGYTQGATQSGMNFGGRRMVSDMDTGRMAQDSQGVVGGQSGYTQGASQQGQSWGGRRDIIN